MNTSTRFLCALPFMLATLPTFAAHVYGPKDEGRRFSDGTRVVCHNVEVKKNSKDSNRIAGTAAGAVVGGLLGNQVGKGGRWRRGRCRRRPVRAGQVSGLPWRPRGRTPLRSQVSQQLLVTRS